MPTWPEIVYGLYGALRLARLDRAGMSFFDQTVEGFWKSFFAAVLVAPGYVVLVALGLIEAPVEAGFLRILLVHLCAYSLRWTVFPVVAYQICGSINRQPAFIGFIVAFNWSQAIQMAAFVPVFWLAHSGLLPGGIGALLSGTIYALVLGYQWFVTRTALDIGASGAIGFVVLDLIIGIMIEAVALGMLH